MQTTPPSGGIGYLMTRILGVDPGLTHTGYGIIEHVGNHLSFVNAGTISPKPKEPLAVRLRHLSSELTNTIETYKPESLAIEQTFVSANGASTLKLGQARGALLLTLAQTGLDIGEYAPNTIKKTIAGSGHADKSQMLTMVKMLLPGCNTTQADAIDALAIAICHAHHQH